MRKTMRATIFILIILFLCLSCSFASAERKTVVRDEYYLGAMRVVKCSEYVSLRAKPDKTSTVLAKVPLDSIVYYCTSNTALFAQGNYKKQTELFVRCEYEGEEGYILRRFLTPAPEFEPAETKQSNELMTEEEITGNGETILSWREFNVSVLASYEEIPEDDSTWETLRVGCFIDDEPIWGYTESVKRKDKYITLRAFMGGTEDEPQVCVYDEEYGLFMLDLMDGIELWTIQKGTCPFGDASVYTVGVNTGILYIAGSEGPDPVAVSSEGNILWRSVVDDPEVYNPTAIILRPNEIEVTYESGKTVLLEYNGELISISDTL